MTNMVQHIHLHHLMTPIPVIQTGDAHIGGGAHHHDRYEERMIRTITSIPRNMTLHSSIHCPDVADASLITTLCQMLHLAIIPLQDLSIHYFIYF